VTVGRIVAVLALAMIVSASAHGAPAPTHVVANVTPFAEDGKLRPGLHVVRRAAGTCEPGSDVLPNDVYRCGFNNFVIDPCWRDHRASTPVVVCLTEPWAKSVVRLALTSAPERSVGGSDPKAEPWGIELESGARCIALQGAHETVLGNGAGPTINYSCSNSLVLVSGVDRRRPLWTIRAARGSSGATPYKITGRVAIKTAWFGGNGPR